MGNKVSKEPLPLLFKPYWSEHLGVTLAVTRSKTERRTEIPER